MNSSYKEDLSVFSLPKVNPSKTIDYSDDHIDHKIDIFLPDKKNSFNSINLIFIHGGYWKPDYNRDHKTNIAKCLSNLGYKVFLIEYRRISGNPDVTLTDVKNSILQIAKYVNSNEKIVLVGHSVGGYHSIMAALDEQINNQLEAMILIAPVTDLKLTDKLDLGSGAVKRFLGEKLERIDDLDPILLKVSNIKTVILHGKEDTAVPIQTSRNYVKYAKEKFGIEIELIEVDNRGHFEFINPKFESTVNVIYEALANLKL